MQINVLQNEKFWYVNCYLLDTLLAYFSFASEISALRSGRVNNPHSASFDGPIAAVGFSLVVLGRCIRVAVADNGCVNDDAISRRRRSVVSPPDRLSVERHAPPGSRIDRRSIMR